MTQDENSLTDGKDADATLPTEGGQNLSRDDEASDSQPTKVDETLLTAPPADSAHGSEASADAEIDATVDFHRDGNGNASGAGSSEMPPADVTLSTRHPFPKSESTGGEDKPQPAFTHTTSADMRFKIRRHHAEGGLGKVYVAEDLELHRDVALKEIKEKFAHDTDEQLRFVVEAEITGGLEHPSIVPIYGLGQYDDGRPYYAMRFIRGESFKAAIEGFHKRDEADRSAGQRELELRKLLRRFIDCCNAMQYAHSRGVLHRDIKPSNVMLGKYGETLLVDWGLAKAKDRDDQFAVQDETSLKPFSLSGTGEVTQRGTTLGTPAYMSPEQAAGQIDHLGPASDVYSLGAMLYHLLVGKSPQSGKKITIVLRDVRLGEFSPPRTANPRVPRPLEAICLKAMALKPGDRYASAAALAEDIEHWLADEPVEAYAEPLVARVARWMRRHRAWTQSIAAALILVTVVSIVAALFVNRARAREAAALASEREAHKKTEEARKAEADARTAEERAKAEALRRFKEAMGALEDWRLDVVNVLKYFPSLQRARRTLLIEAAQDYDRLASEYGDDPDIQLVAAQAKVQLGIVHELLNELKYAEQAYRSAESLLVALGNQENAADDIPHELAKCRGKLAVALDKAGRFADAKEAFQRATDGLDKLIETVKDNADLRATRAEIQIDHANLIAFLNEFAAAKDLLSAAEADVQKLIADAPKNVRYRRILTAAQVQLGAVAVRNEENPTAVTIFNTAIDTFHALIAADPDKPEHVDGLARCRIYLATAYRALGRIEDEIKAYRGAIADYEALLRSLPDVPYFTESLALTQTDLAQILNDLGENAEAQTLLESAHVVYAHLATTYQQPQYVQGLAACRSALGSVLVDLNDNDKAQLAFELAVDGFDSLVENFDAPEYQERRAAARRNLARLFIKVKDYEAAESHLQLALSDYRALLTNFPDTPKYQDGMAWCYEFLGEARLAAGQKAGARTAYEQAIDLCDKLPETPQYQYHVASLLADCPLVELRDTKRAVAAAAKLTAAVATNGKYWTALAAAHYRDGEYDACLDAVKHVHDGYPLKNSPHPFWQAMALWQRNKDDDRTRAAEVFEEAAKSIQEHAPGRVEPARSRDEAAKLLKPPTPAENQSPPPNK